MRPVESSSAPFCIRFDMRPMGAERPLAHRNAFRRSVVVMDRPRSRAAKQFIRARIYEHALKTNRAVPIFRPGTPVFVHVLAVFDRPKSRAGAVWSPHAIRPDVENVAKLILDGAAGMLYHDDAQVFSLLAEEWQGPTGTVPYVELAAAAYGDMAERWRDVSLDVQRRFTIGVVA